MNPTRRTPRLLPAGAAFVADNATVVGRVALGSRVSIWYGCVVRGDVASISIGPDTNVQDLTVIHPQHDEDIEVGCEVTIGHGVILHCRSVGDGSLLGMGSILLPGARIGRRCLVGAGALVPQGMEVEDECVVLGSPARVVRKVKPSELQMFRETTARYLDLIREHS